MTARIELKQPVETAAALAPLHDAPEMIDPVLLEAECKSLSAAQVAYEQAMRRKLEAAAAVAEAEQDIRNWVSANPSCPVCGGDVTVEKLLEGGHAHAH